MSQIITNAFASYWQTCLATQAPVVLDEFVLANIPGLDPDAPINPDGALPPAGQIVHRHHVDQRGRINNDAVAYTIVMDTTLGDFEFNAMYLINKATGMVAMIVHKGSETKLKTDPLSGQVGNSLVKSMLMEYDRASEATVTNVDANTWQIDYAARLRGMDDDLRLQALQFFGPATFYGDGFQLVNEAGVYKVQPGVAYVGGLRAQLDQVQKITPGAKPVGLWLDIYRAGSLLDAWLNHFTLTLSVADKADYTDGNGYRHHLAKVAIINSDGSVTDLRRKRTIELSGDVTGKGILEDAQGVNIAVEIKAGSHRHSWGELDNAPDQATRWPNWDEVNDKPALASEGHSHDFLDLKNLDWNVQSDKFMTGSAQAPKGSGSTQFLNWISWGHNGGSKYRHTLFSPTSAIHQLWYGYKANGTDTTSPSTNVRLYHTNDKPSLAELGAAAASHSHPWSQISGPPAQATRWPSWGEVSGKPNLALAVHAHSASLANADIVGSGWGQVGTYCFATCIVSTGGNKGPGYAIAGSSLRAANSEDGSPGIGAALPGTWKLVGAIKNGGNSDQNTSLWIRIS
ncbi:phage tail-collar fiber domain-containing protein [Aeromonas rivuli]|uniref:phage tail-collar fiber domain-containing protein n=1 Tax=Aeromonas rivuli TaxID=648794 RepID=UPI000AF1A9DC|nr:phage tail protein [Aeromonas rivuli]